MNRFTAQSAYFQEIAKAADRSVSDQVAAIMADASLDIHAKLDAIEKVRA